MIIAGGLEETKCYNLQCHPIIIDPQYEDALVTSEASLTS